MADAKAAYYVEPGAKLSQGDLVKDVPWGLLPDPTTVCRPNNKDAEHGKAYYTPRHLTKQGGVAFGGGTELIHAQARLGMAMVLWHDCEIDKFEEKEKPKEDWFAAVAPVLPLSLIQQADQRERVVAGDRIQLFPLPPLEPVNLPDSFVDLRHIWSVKQTLLTDRVASLGDVGRNALYEHLFTFLTRNRIRETVLCPACLATIKSADVFEAVAGED